MNKSIAFAHFFFFFGFDHRLKPRYDFIPQLPPSVGVTEELRDIDREVVKKLAQLFGEIGRAHV